MKKLAVLACLAITLYSCKKDNVQPDVITKTNTVHDTVHTPHLVYDTVYISPAGLVGAWKCYQSEDINSGVSVIHPEPWLFDFTSSQFNEDLDANGSYEYNYAITYGSNYVDIVYPSIPATYTYVVTSVGAEYRLTRIISSSQSQVWYLRK